METFGNHGRLDQGRRDGLQGVQGLIELVHLGADFPSMATCLSAAALIALRRLGVEVGEVAPAEIDGGDPVSFPAFVVVIAAAAAFFPGHER